MKKLIFYISCILLISNNTKAAPAPPRILKSYHRIISLILHNKAEELSHLVIYPLGRRNPLPDITSPQQFVKAFPVLFDDAFKRKLRTYNDTVVFEHYFDYGLVGGEFAGDMWLNEDGKLKGVTRSKAEQKIQDKLTAEIKSRIYPTVNQWQENILVAKSKNLLIRIDYTTKGYRYVCWSKGHQLTDRPDIVIYKGSEESRGTQGGWTWTFKNGKWSYVVDQVDLCETDDKCGLFLRLFYNDDEKNTVRLKEKK